MSSSAHRTTQPSAKPKRRRWASIIDTAEHLGVTERTMRQMIADGRLTGYRSTPVTDTQPVMQRVVDRAPRPAREQGSGVRSGRVP
jgi:hypothetical protein